MAGEKEGAMYTEFGWNCERMREDAELAKICGESWEVTSMTSV